MDHRNGSKVLMTAPVAQDYTCDGEDGEGQAAKDSPNNGPDGCGVSNDFLGPYRCRWRVR